MAKGYKWLFGGCEGMIEWSEGIKGYKEVIEGGDDFFEGLKGRHTEGSDGQ